MNKLVLKDLHNDLNQSEMREIVGGEKQKDVYIFSSDTLAILGYKVAAEVRKYEEGVQEGGHHQ